MDVLFVLMHFGKDGVSTNVLDLTEGLVNRGHTVSVITSGFRKGISTNLEFYESIQEKFQKWNVKTYYFKEPSGDLLKRGYQALSSMLYILKKINVLKPDIIHCHSPNLTFLPWLLRKKFVSTVHSDVIKPNFKYKHPTILIAVSEGSKHFTETVMRSKPETVRIVHHGISKRFATKTKQIKLEALKEKYNISNSNEKVTVGFVGRLAPVKGIDTLLNTVGNYLPQDVLQKIQLVLLGDYLTEQNENWVEGLVRDNNLEKIVSIVPFQDPKPFYDLFDILVLPSRSDTFGLVAVEAMMSGCCTIRSDSFGAIDQIDHGQNGFIFKVNDENGLGVLLNQVIANRELRKNIGRKGKEKALNSFTIEKMVHGTIDVYKELLQL
ncbi:glycosyltransferase family 4 protein [uncultured Croceitalea sp.]|uniref:glycosyltransferase family 4 protein n=1 Tax=uncultured Croceitalea sp. TaxID=1798908 RepID=UPI0033065BB0